MMLSFFDTESIGHPKDLFPSGLAWGGPGYLGGGGGVVRPKIVGLLKKNKPPTFFAQLQI